MKKKEIVEKLSDFGLIRSRRGQRSQAPLHRQSQACHRRNRRCHICPSRDCRTGLIRTLFFTFYGAGKHLHAKIFICLFFKKLYIKW